MELANIYIAQNNKNIVMYVYRRMYVWGRGEENGRNQLGPELHQIVKHEFSRFLIIVTKIARWYECHSRYFILLEKK